MVLNAVLCHYSFSIGVIDISSIEKLERRFRMRPIPNDISYAQFARLLTAYGFVLRCTSGTSHRLFVYNKNGYCERVGCKVPHGNEKGVLEPYVEMAIEAIDRIREKQISKNRR